MFLEWGEQKPWLEFQLGGGLKTEMEETTSKEVGTIGQKAEKKNLNQKDQELKHPKKQLEVSISFLQGY